MEECDHDPLAFNEALSFGDSGYYKMKWEVIINRQQVGIYNKYVVVWRRNEENGVRHERQ